jgi:hypothetical protein
MTGFVHDGARYEVFYSDMVREMPRLIAAGYSPLSIAQGMNLRLKMEEIALAPPVNKENLLRHTNLLTGDGIICNKDGEAIMVLDAPILQKIPPKVPLPDYGILLDEEQWEELKNSNSVLHYSARDVKKSYGGYTQRRGKLVPENMLVEEVWKFLSRDTNLDHYVQLEGEIKFRSKDEGSFMIVDLLHSVPRPYATLKPLMLESVDYNYRTFTCLHGAPVYDASPKGLHRLLIGTASIKS